MTDPADMVATRRLVMTKRQGGAKRDVLIEISRPVRRQEQGDFVCSLRLRGVGSGESVVPVFGVDAVQTLQLVFPVLEAQLDYWSRHHEATIGWEEGSANDSP